MSENDTKSLIVDQPQPVAERVEQPVLWTLVIQDAKRLVETGYPAEIVGDMVARDRVGRARYGTPLQPHNGRDALIDAYQEALDLTVYLKQYLVENVETRHAGEMRRINLMYRDALDLVTRIREAINLRSEP